VHRHARRGRGPRVFADGREGEPQVGKPVKQPYGDQQQIKRIGQQVAVEKRLADQGIFESSGMVSVGNVSICW
jgi:hypothetical protein